MKQVISDITILKPILYLRGKVKLSCTEVHPLKPFSKKSQDDNGPAAFSYSNEL